MHPNEDDEFEIIDSHYELTDSNSSSHDPLPQKRAIIYQVSIKPTKIEVDLSIMENQYYQLDVKKRGLNYCTVERRFSEFELIYDILWRKEGGYIFPAFPENGIFAFMKSKVVISKDEEFVNRRLRTIERFMNIIMNDSLFDPEQCKEFKEFLSAGREFEARKQIQKNNKPIFSFSWNKLKNYFATTKENKYSDKQQKLQKIKNRLQSLYAKCRTLMDCLKEQFAENERFLMMSHSNEVLRCYKEMMEEHDCLQRQNLKKLEELQFEMFCENEDLHMCDKIFERINELKNNEDNYIELKAIENRFEAQIDGFMAQKAASTQSSEEALRRLVAEVKKVGRIVK